MENTEIKPISWKVIDFAGKEVSTYELPGDVYGVDVEKYQHTVQLVVKADLANRRQATAKTKVRSEVRGGGKKPWRQKGTGRARAGSSRSPIWVGGGTVFGPDGRQNYKLKVNKSVHFLALCTALSDKVASNNLIIVDDSKKFESPKTKEFIKVLEAINAKGKTLMVINNDPEKFDDNLVLASGNVSNVVITSPDNLSVYDIVNAKTLVIFKSVLDESEGE